MEGSIVIYNQAGTQLASFSSVPEGSRNVMNLMTEDYMELKFSLAAPVIFPIGAYADFTGYGRYYVCEQQNPSYSESTGGYEYTLKMSAFCWYWNNWMLKYRPGSGANEYAFSLTAKISVHIDLVLRNLAAEGFKYDGLEYIGTVDSTVTTEAKVISYNAVGITDALTTIANTFECEWWIVGNVIYFGRCESEGSTELEVGYNVETMTSSGSRTDYATRLYVFGSTKNLNDDYRKVTGQEVTGGVVEKRLMLPSGTPYIQASGVADAEVVEGVKVFDDIYPRRTGTISTVTTYQKTTEDSETGEEVTKTYYRFTDTGINFSSDYILEGEELNIIFETGSLAGLTFGVVFNPNGAAEKTSSGDWNPDAQLWEIVMNEDYGTELPVSPLIPKVGDTYVLSGFDISLVADSYVSAAENELLDAGREYLEKTQIDPNTYTCTMLPDFPDLGWDYDTELYDSDSEQLKDSDGEELIAIGIRNTFALGEKVILKNSAFFKSGSRESRIIGWEKNLDYEIDSPKYIVGETVSAGLQSRVSNLEDDSDNAITLLNRQDANMSRYKFLLETFAKENQHTYIEGGLILSSILELGYGEDATRVTMAGMNGIYEASLAGKGIAAWYGGNMVDKENETGATNAATSLFRFDGSGYLADGQISWGYDEDEGAIVVRFGDKARIDATNINFSATENLDLTAAAISLAAKSIVFKVGDNSYNLSDILSVSSSGSVGVKGGKSGVLECANGAKITWNGGILTDVTGFDS